MTTRRVAATAIAAIGLWSFAPTAASPVREAEYRWSREIDSAAFEGSYNFPVFVVRGEMWAFHPQGKWRSRDGRSWTRTGLPSSGLNTGYQRYVNFNDAVYALGTMRGNYLDLHLTSRVARTRDFEHWETLATESNLPARVFYGAVAHQGKSGSSADSTAARTTMTCGARLTAYSGRE